MMNIFLLFSVAAILLLSGCTGYLTAENAVTSATSAPSAAPSSPEPAPTINLSCAADDLQNCGPSCGQRCGSYCATRQSYGAPVQAFCSQGTCACICQCASGWTGVI